MHFYHWRQTSQKDLAQSWVARQESAYESGDLAAAAKSRDLEPLGQVFRERAQGVHRLFGPAVAQQVRVTVRENYDVTSSQFFPSPIRELGIGTPFGQEVVHNQVSRSG